MKSFAMPTPLLKKKMSSKVSSFLERGKVFLGSSTNDPDSSPRGEHGFRKAPNETSLFPKTDPNVDGEDCDRDCDNCVVQYPKKWSINEDDKLYGKVNGWSTVGRSLSNSPGPVVKMFLERISTSDVCQKHILIATGKTDWVKDVADEKGSVMEAIRDCGIEPGNGVFSSHLSPDITFCSKCTVRNLCSPPPTFLFPPIRMTQRRTLFQPLRFYFPNSDSSMISLQPLYLS